MIKTSRDRRPYDGLTPDTVLAAVESVGLLPDRRLFALNSYENRVYRLGLETPLPGESRPGEIVADVVIAKFYREGRWSDAQLREEHEFGRELADAELPVAAPLSFAGETLHRHEGFRFALFECRIGGAPELDAPEARGLLGRTLGRLHAVGARRRFRTRRVLGSRGWGAAAREEVLSSGLVPPEVEPAYAATSARVVAAIRAATGEGFATVRLHGDGHLGNVLWNAHGPVFVDLDDCLQGPRVQDLWMFVAGDGDRQRAEWTALLDGYEQFATFDFREVALIEPLRALRMIEHAAWLAERFDDPAFPRAFPWFGEPRYWERHVAELAEQLEVMQDPPLLRG